MKTGAKENSRHSQCHLPAETDTPQAGLLKGSGGLTQDTEAAQVMSLAPLTSPTFLDPKGVVGEAQSRQEKVLNSSSLV